MSGAQRLRPPAVYGVVHEAPFGQTTPALRQAVRSVEVLIGRLSPVWTRMYVPLDDFTTAGSCTVRSPVTLPGLGYACGAGRSTTPDAGPAAPTRLSIDIASRTADFLGSMR